MIVLGYNGFSNIAAYYNANFGRIGKDRHRIIGHDASAALFKDGILVAAAEEERFDRVKKSSAFPKNAINYCLQEGGISIEDVDYIAFPWNFDENIVSKILADILLGEGNLHDKIVTFEKFKNLYIGLVSPGKIMNDFNLNFNTDFDPGRFVFVPHHFAHIMTGFYVSGMEKSAFLITDGRGETLSSIMGEIDHHSVKLFEASSISIQDSIGILYTKFTRYLGFVPNCDEFKIMALSTFSKSPPGYDFSKIIKFLPNGRFELQISKDQHNDAVYYKFFRDFFGERSEETDRNMAYVIQKITEMAVWHQIKFLREKTDCENLFLEGGVAMNCVNNSQILKNSQFKNVNVSFAANDSGVCIGAAFYPFYKNNLLKDGNIVTPYLGPSFSSRDILVVLNEKSTDLDFREFEEDELLELVADHMLEKKVIGWFQGKMEFGPRALGNRSILASPLFPDMKDILNEKVKHREPFRPFAGIILEEEANNFFEMGKKNSSPFMTIVFDVKPEYKDKLQSTLHIDGTSRLQTVSKEQNPKLHELISRFFNKTGIPCIINTSFNVQGEPIVCEPRHAVNCFLGTRIDVLVIENFIIYKKEGRGV
jgi:carbamoyltransferase